MKRKLMTPLIAGVLFMSIAPAFFYSAAADQVSDGNKNKSYLIPNYQNKSRAKQPTSSEPQTQDGTEANLNTAWIRCSPDADVTISNKHHLIDISSGELLVVARKPIAIRNRRNLIMVNKGAVVQVSAANGVCQIHNLMEGRANSVKAKIHGVPFKLRVGEELMLAGNFAQLQRTAQSDGIQRRGAAIFQFADYSQLLSCEFSPITLLKSSRLMREITHSSQVRDKVLVNKLIKMTACLSIATVSHGYYMPIMQASNADRPVGYRNPH